MNGHPTLFQGRITDVAKVKRYVDADTGTPHVFVKGGPGYNGETSAPKVNAIYVLLRKDQPKWEGFSFMPKGEVS